MKKLLPSFFIFSSLLSFAQDWSPFPLGQKSFYSNTLTGNPIVKSINIIQFDSITNSNGQQTLFFNYTDTNFHNCYENVFHEFNSLNQNNNYVTYFRPDSIIMTNDSLQLIYSNYNSNDSILFLPNSSINQYWFSEINN